MTIKFKKDQINLEGLDRIKRILKQELPIIQIGILGDKDARNNDNSNATIGARHEYGTEGMPERSFLRMPLNTQYNNYLGRSKIINKKTIDKIVREKSLKGFAQQLGIIAEEVIADAFASGGFGKWKKSNMKRKKNKQTLVETQQLRDSITSRVK